MGGSLTTPVARSSASEASLPKPVLCLGLDVGGFENLDPHSAVYFQDRLIVDMVYNALVRYTPGNVPNTEPDLAERLPRPFMEAGKQVWIFKIKSGVFFHTGPETAPHELTADDVVYSLTRSADPARSRNAKAYRGMVIKKVDKFTVEITLDQPLSSRLFMAKVSNYGGGFIVSKRAVAAMGDDALRSHPVGTGPFRFDRYDRKENRLHLRGHELYFRGSPRLGGIELCFYSKTDDLPTDFKSGRLDAIRGRADTDWIDKIQKIDDTIVDTFGAPHVIGIRFRPISEPLSNVDVRRAMAYALDRSEFLAGLSPRHTGPAFAPAPAHFLPGGLTDAEVKTFGLDFSTDLERAKALLTQAGYPNGFSLDLTLSELNPHWKSYKILAGQLKRIDITINFHHRDGGTEPFLPREDRNPITIYEVFAPNIDDFLTRLFYSGTDTEKELLEYNAIDKIIELARAETLPSAQIKLWKYAQMKLLEDMIIYPLCCRRPVYARKSYVDYGHAVKEAAAIYPQFTEATGIVK